MEDPFKESDVALNNILNSSIVIPKMIGYIDLKIKQYKRTGPGVIDMETIIDDLAEDKTKMMAIMAELKDDN